MTIRLLSRSVQLVVLRCYTVCSDPVFCTDLQRACSPRRWLRRPARVVQTRSPAQGAASLFMGISQSKSVPGIY
jgi:hypothetical protein